jgi:anti-sigma B factor antagonist
MDWTVDTLVDKVIGRPTGRVDEGTWEAFSDNLIAAVRQAKAAGVPLVVDLAGLQYMASRGLRALTLARNEAGADIAIVLAAPNDRMREILQISRYDKLFKVVDSVAAAV